MRSLRLSSLRPLRVCLRRACVRRFCVSRACSRRPCARRDPARRDPARRDLARSESRMCSSGLCLPVLSAKRLPRDARQKHRKSQHVEQPTRTRRLSPLRTSSGRRGDTGSASRKRSDQSDPFNDGRYSRAMMPSTAHRDTKRCLSQGRRFDKALKGGLRRGSRHGIVLSHKQSRAVAVSRIQLQQVAVSPSQWR